MCAVEVTGLLFGEFLRFLLSDHPISGTAILDNLISALDFIYVLF